MPPPPLRSRRAPCALHGLAVADDGQCVRCRRDDDATGGGLGWPILFAIGCCAAGLLGWQAAKMGPDALSLRPQHHLAVVSLEATSPVEQLRREQRDATRSRVLVRPDPVAPAHAPRAVEVTVTEAEKKAFEPPPAPAPFYGAYDADPPEPTTIIVKLAPPTPPTHVPVFRGRGPASAPGGGNGRPRPAIPRRPSLLPPPGDRFPAEVPASCGTRGAHRRGREPPGARLGRLGRRHVA